MRAHSLRKTLWTLDVALGAAVLAVVGWYVLRVHPAVAADDVTRPAWADAAVADFEARPPVSPSLAPPVSQEELEEIDRPAFRTPQGRRYHWLYSGPLPPPPPRETATPGPVAPQPKGLETQGRVVMIIYPPPGRGVAIARDAVVFWEFKSQRKVAFQPGDWVTEPGQDRRRFKLANVRPLGEQRYRIEYDVYDDPEGDPTERQYLEHDGSVVLDPAIQARILSGFPGTPAAPGAPAATPAEAAAGGAVAGAGEPAAEEGAVGEEAAATAVEPGVAEPVEPAAAPSGDVPPVTSIRPEVVRESINDVRVNLDENTFEYFRQVEPDDVARTVKTQVARDANGEVLGLQVTGLSADSPATRFQIQPGDILISINGRRVQSRSDAVAVAETISPDTRSVQVVLDRNGRRITYTVDPGDPATRRAVSTRVARELRERGETVPGP